jgi:hypothetical protein
MMGRASRSSDGKGSAGGRGKSGPSRWSDASLARKAAWATILGLPLAAITLVVGIATSGGGSSSNASSAREPSLRSVDVVVRNPDHGDQAPRVEITTHNVGTRRVVITRARVRVDRVEPLRLCISQGDLPLGQPYDVTLPLTAGRTVDIPIERQLGDDRADRFALALGVPQARPGKGLVGVRLYRLHLVLLNDGSSGPLDVGEVLVAVPSLPYRGGYYWTSSTAHELGYYRSWFPRLLPCWRANTARLRAMMALPGARSPDLAGIADEMIDPSPS